jgi:hypothetical protein
MMFGIVFDSAFVNGIPFLAARPGFDPCHHSWLEPFFCRALRGTVQDLRLNPAQPAQAAGLIRDPQSCSGLLSLNTADWRDTRTFIFNLYLSRER